MGQTPPMQEDGCEEDTGTNGRGSTTKCTSRTLTTMGQEGLCLLTELVHFLFFFMLWYFVN
jgi:hypothetical protein